MGLRDSLRALGDRWANEQRMLTPAQFWGSGSEFRVSGMTAAGKRITLDSALALPVVQRAFTLVSGDIGTLAIDTFRRVDGRRVPIDTPRWVEVPDPANPNFRRPQFVSRCVVSLMGDGNLFVRAIPNRFAPVIVRVIDPAKVRVETDADGRDWYWVGNTRLGSDEVLHIPYLTLPHANRGPSPIDLLSESIATGLAAEEFGGRFFANGAVMSGIVEAPAGAVIDADKLKKDLERNHRGVSNSHAIGVLTGGATWRQTGVNAQDSQLLELQKFVVENVGRAYGIPPYLLGSQEPGAVAYASTSNARIDYVQHGIQPIVSRIEHALSTLIPGEDTFLRFNLNTLLRGDIAARYQALNTAAQAGVITKDEWRAWEDWGPADEAEGVGTEHGGFLSTPNNTGPGGSPAPQETQP